MYEDENYLICRLCLNSCGSYIDIFNPKGTNGLLVWKILKELLQLDVSVEDGLPVTICEGCVGKLTEFKYFKAMCINSRIEFLKAMVNRGLVGGETGVGLPFPRSKLGAVSRQSPSYPLEIMEIPEDRDPLDFLIEVKPQEEEEDKAVPEKKSSSFTIASFDDEMFPDKTLDEDVVSVEMEEGASNSCTTVEEEVKEVVGREEVIEVKTVKEKYVCHQRDCGKTFTSLKGLRIHALRWHEPEQGGERGVNWGCPFCPFKVGSRKTLAVHVRTQHKIGPQKVATIGRKESKPSKSKAGPVMEGKAVGSGDISTFTASDPTGTKLLNCSMNLTNVSKVGNSGSTEVEATPGKSDYPKGGYQGMTEFAPCKEHDGKPEFTCSDCPKRFNDKRSLKVHLEAVHKDKKLYSCKKCVRDFKTFLLFEKHSLMHRNKKDLSFWCGYCYRAFPSSSALTVHMREIHNISKPFVCKVCCGGRKSDLSRHQCRLFGNLFPCHQCGRFLKHRQYITKHKKSCRGGVKSGSR